MRRFEPTPGLRATLVVTASCVLLGACHATGTIAARCAAQPGAAVCPGSASPQAGEYVAVSLDVSEAGHLRRLLEGDLVLAVVIADLEIARAGAPSAPVRVEYPVVVVSRDAPDGALPAVARYAFLPATSDVGVRLRVALVPAGRAEIVRAALLDLARAERALPGPGSSPVGADEESGMLGLPFGRLLDDVDFQVAARRTTAMVELASRNVHVVPAGDERIRVPLDGGTVHLDVGSTELGTLHFHRATSRPRADWRRSEALTCEALSGEDVARLAARLQVLECALAETSLDERTLALERDVVARGRAMIDARTHPPRAPVPCLEPEPATPGAIDPDLLAEHRAVCACALAPVAGAPEAPAPLRRDEEAPQTTPDTPPAEGGST